MAKLIKTIEFIKEFNRKVRQMWIEIEFQESAPSEIIVIRKRENEDDHYIYVLHEAKSVKKDEE